MKSSKINFMRYLASRFVLNDSVELHTLDPYWDLRPRFKDLKKLKDNIQARNLRVDVEEVAKSYTQWWEKFTDFHEIDKKKRQQDFSDEDKRTRSMIKQQLYDLQNGILSALSLPNDLVSSSSLPNQQELRQSPTIGRNPFHDSVSLQFLNKLSEHTRLVSGIRQKLDDNLQLFKISPPRMVRPAIVEACNLELESFPMFQEGNHPPMSLVGVSLPSMLATFVLHRISVTSILILADNPENLSKTTQEVQHSLQECVKTHLNLALDQRILPPSELKLWESQAHLLNASDGMEMIRIGYAGTYLSERCVITYLPDAWPPNFVHVAYVEVDLDAIALYMRNHENVSGLLTRLNC